MKLPWIVFILCGGMLPIVRMAVFFIEEVSGGRAKTHPEFESLSIRGDGRQRHENVSP